MSGFESIVEEATIQWLEGIGYTYKPGPDLAHDGSAPERRNYADVFLEGRLNEALARINPKLESDILDEVAPTCKDDLQVGGPLAPAAAQPSTLVRVPRLQYSAENKNFMLFSEPCFPGRSRAASPDCLNSPHRGPLRMIHNISFSIASRIPRHQDGDGG